MTPTLIGLLTCAFGAWLAWRGSLMSLLCAMLAAGIFEASAALVLPALSGSSIPPPRLLLLFLLIAAAQELNSRSSLLREALVANAPLMIFTLYGVISAFTLPHLFAGQIHVVPMRPAGLRHLTDAFPLSFSPQNITTAFYLAGTGLTALCAYVAGRLSSDIGPLVRTCVGITILHALTGLAGVVLVGTPWDLVVDFVRNGSYSQLSQATSSYVRVTGLMAEPANYARFGMVWFILSFELWLRNISPRWTGWASLLMGFVLAISTSSTAYVGLAGYGLIVAMRFATKPTYLEAGHLLKIAMWGLAACMAGVALVLFYSPVATAFASMLDQMTVQKASSLSGQQRLFWAMQGIDAFVFSGGLGIGAGSFRSSSLLMAIAGSMGVVGMIAFAAACISLFLPRPYLEDRVRDYVSQALAWSAFVGLIPAMVMGGAPDPGMEFAAFSGLSLALRLPALQSRKVSHPPRWGGEPVAVARKPRVRRQAIPLSGGWRRSAR